MDSKQLKCVCGYKWLYKGLRKVYATCPDCKRQVKIVEVTP